MAMSLGLKASTLGGTDEVVKRDKIYALERKFEEIHIVVATLAEGELDVLAAIGIPYLGQTRYGAPCRRRTPQEIEIIAKNPFTGQVGALWEVRCEYDSTFDPQQTQDGGNDTLPPDERATKHHWEGEETMEHLPRDIITGRALTTTAGEPFFVEHPVADPVLVIQRWEPYPFDPLVILTYSNFVNEVEFWGAPEGTARMMPIVTGDEEPWGTDNPQLFCPVTYRIWFKMRRDPEEPTTFLSNTWMGEQLNAGHMYKISASRPSIRATDEQGNPVIVNLDNLGFRLTGVFDPDLLTYVRYNRFMKVDFNNLNLGPF